MRAPIFRTVEYDHGDTFTYWPLSDIHWEAADCCHEALVRDVECIQKDPFARVLLMGDQLDGIFPQDRKRWVPGIIHPKFVEAAMDPHRDIVDEVTSDLADVLRPIADRIDVILEGNHETAMAKYYNHAPGSMLASKLGIPERFGGYQRDLVLRLKRRSSKAAGAQCRVVFDLHHGWQGGGRAGGGHFANMMQRELAYSDADIIIRGHSHERFARVWQARKSGVEHQYGWYRAGLIAGTYKLGWITDNPGSVRDTWEIQRAFSRRIPEGLGSPRIRITPGRSANPSEPKVYLGILDESTVVQAAA